MKKLIQDPRVKYAFILFHVLCSFLWAGHVFKNLGVIAIGTKVVNPIVSDRFEIVMARVLSECFAILIIWCFWQLVFHLLQKFRKSYMVFLAIWLIGLILLLLGWPAVFEQSNDNYITYSCAVRLTPDYWHCAYSGFVYAGCLLFFPADFMITVVQWSFMAFLLAYAFYRLETIAPRLRFLIFGFWLLPNTYLMSQDSYRILQYLIVALLYLVILFSDILENRERTTKEALGLAALGAFLCVWRTEGAIFSFVFYLIHVICTQKGTIWSKSRRLLCFIILFFLIMIPQKIGEIKYYGNDYFVINSMYPLQCLLNNPNTDLGYARAAQDLEAIEAVVPVAVVKEYGLDGYRRYNYHVKGNPDFNQSAATKEQSKALLSAYVSILLHNPENAAKLVWDNVLYAFSARHAYYWAVPIPEEEHVPLAQWGTEMWSNTAFDLYSNAHTVKWAELVSPLGLGQRLTGFWVNYKAKLFQKRIFFYAFFVFLAINLIIFLAGTILSLRKKDGKYFAFGLSGLAMLGEYAAILLVAPVPASVYFLIADYVTIALGGYAFLFYTRRIQVKTENGRADQEVADQKADQ